MGGLIQPTPVAEERDSSKRTIAIAVAVVIVVAIIFAFLFRSQPKTASGPPPYAASLKLSDFKMSAVENFVGATVSYVDGTITNAGNKTVTHVIVEVLFKDDLGQLAQREDIPMQVLKTTGPYPEAVDFSVSPLAPGQSTTFRLTFESISAQWNRQYPDIQVTDVTVK
jgi:heme/copper-type cytochrome/quinol oxidase subunit 2